MNHWPFIIAAYALTGVGTLGLLGYSLLAMWVSEKVARELRRDE